ncbi:11529_t:CDS:1, partial [Acaulospora colombiana]
ASGFTPSHIEIFCKALENHLDWSHRRYKSPFISTFGDQRHALNWARRWIARNQGDCWIEEIYIDPYESGHVRVFRVKDLVDGLSLEASLDRSQYESEYLFLHGIPQEFIVARTKLQ